MQWDLQFGFVDSATSKSINLSKLFNLFYPSLASEDANSLFIAPKLKKKKKSLMPVVDMY